MSSASGNKVPQRMWREKCCQRHRRDFQEINFAPLRGARQPQTHQTTKFLQHISRVGITIFTLQIWKQCRETKPLSRATQDEGAVLGSELMPIDFSVFLLHHMTARMQAKTKPRIGWLWPGILQPGTSGLPSGH